MRFAIVLAICVASVSDERPRVRTWRYQTQDGKSGTISGRDEGEWTEIRPVGEPPTTFKFIRHTNRFTELYDKDRNFTLILYWDGESEWSVGHAWNSWLKGKWDD